jgi:ABC-2 type transport system permease protein
MHLSKILIIARREFMTNIRRRAFWFTLFGLPLILAGSTFIGGALGAAAANDTSGFKAVGIVDQAGFLTANGKTPSIELVKPFVYYPTEAAAQADFESGITDGYYVLTDEFYKTRVPKAYYRREKLFGEAINDRLFEKVLRPAAAAKLGNEALAKRLTNPLEELVVYREGTDVPLEENALLAAIFVPVIMGMLMFTLSMSNSQYLMQGLVEEKENRMMEVFITSALPVELLWGKLLGLGALGLLQIVVWIALGLTGALLFSGLNLGTFLATYGITPSYLLVLTAYVILGFGFFGAVMAAIGAVSNTDQESRQLAGWLTLPALLPALLIALYFVDPNGSLPVFFSLFPLTSPVGMILRASMTLVPPEQVIASLAILAVSVVGTIWIAAKVMRLGMLNYGKRPSLRQLLRAIRRGQTELIAKPTLEGRS